MNKSVLACAAACALAVPGLAQTAPAAVQTAPAPASTTTVAVLQQTNATTLRAGTPVPLKMREELTTKGKKLKVGHRFHMEVAEPIIVNGVTVIPAGSPAIGEVTDVRNKGMWGKSGKINARVLYVTANGRQIRMSGQVDDKGTAGGIGAAAVSAVVFLPAGFFMTGTSARIPMGAPVNGFIDEDVPLTFATVPAATMAVASPTQP